MSSVKKSIKTKVTLAVFFTISTLVIFVSYILISYFHTLLKETIFNQQFVLVSQIADELDNRIELARSQLSLAAAAIDSKTLADPLKLEHALADASATTMIFDAGFLIVSTDGRVLTECMGFPELIGKDLSFRDYIRETLKNGKPFISSPFRLIVAPHTPTIAFTVPVRDDSDHIICILVGYHSLGTDQFLTNLSSTQMGESAFLTLFNERTIIVHEQKERILEVIPEGKNAGLDKAIGGFEGSLVNINSKGEELLSSFKRIGKTGWILGANTPYEDAFIPLYHLALNATLIAIAGLFFSLMIIWLVVRRLTIPLIELNQCLQGATLINSEWTPLAITTGDEVEALADTFNSLMNKLHLQTDNMKAAQIELHQQKTFVEEMLNKAAVPIFVLDINHKIIVWNSAIEDMTGVSADVMLGTNHQWLPFYESERPVLADIVLSADDSSLRELYETHRESQHVRSGQQAELWLENIGGKRRYLLFDAAPIYDDNRLKIGAIETLLDITERKLAEDEQRKLSWAVSENPCTIVITDKEGTIEYVNRKFCTLTGYTAEEAIGQNPRILKSGEMSQESYAELWREISHGKTWRGEFHNKKKDGELYWELASISPVMDKDGEITHYLAVKEDITTRKLTEIELTASKLELQNQHKELNKIFKQMEKAKLEWEDTLDCISDMVLMCDTYGKIKRCNRPVAELTTLSYENILGKNWMTLLSGVGIQVVDFNGQHGSMFDPKSERSFEMNISPIKHSDTPLQTGTVVSIHDTTVLKTMNSKLESAYSELQHTQSQILQQEKMASIGQLAAGVAHEINNPMGFISSNLSSLGKYMEKISAFNVELMEAIQNKGDSATVTLLNELRKKMKIDFILSDISGLLAESHDGADRVRRIVQDLKSFSHVDETESKPFSVNECLTTTLNMARNEIKYVADVVQELDPDLPLINCYPQQLNQVFMNILVNAGHAIEGHGTIKVQSELEGSEIVVKISDTGKGIPPENLSRIFEPFFTTKEVGKGTGLGLSISYDIIKKHGGVMNVESEVGVGTTFIIRLPLHSAELKGANNDSKI